MSNITYTAICIYYYCTEIGRAAAMAAAILTTAFAIHKIVSWALWVMSL